MQHPEEPDVRAVQADPRRDDQVRLHQILVLFLHDEDVSSSFLPFHECFRLQVHSGHRHGETQRDPQQVQSHAAGVRLHQQGPQGSGEEEHAKYILHTKKTGS